MLRAPATEPPGELVHATGFRSANGVIGATTPVCAAREVRVGPLAEVTLLCSDSRHLRLNTLQRKAAHYVRVSVRHELGGQQLQYILKLVNISHSEMLFCPRNPEAEVEVGGVGLFLRTKER